MYVLIRHLGTSGGSQHAFKDEEQVVDTLAIGRGTDQDLQLPDERVALQHATIQLSAGQLKVHSIAATGITVNGRSCKVATLATGDQLLIGNYRLVVLPAQQDVDLALSVELLAQQDAPAIDPQQFNTRLDKVSWLQPRHWAWTLFILLLVLSLAIPATVILEPRWAELARTTPLPDDNLWLSGPLHSVHSNIDRDCQACHTKPFERVRNDVCTACHETTPHHVPVDHPDLALFDGERCASCHHEHNGEVRMVLEDQRFCADCHGGLDARMHGTPTVGSATDFLADHPPLRFSLLEWQAQTRSWTQSERQQADAALREASRLSFDHAQHLDPDGVKNEAGSWEVLACDSCHTPAADAINMAPINMEQHCARCHALTFDAADPTRTVPHGDATQVIASLREFYSARFIQSRSTPTHQATRPGQSQEISRLQREGLAWVERQTLETAEDLFERRACATCHEVERIAQEPPAWHVQPVRLNHRWFVSSEFPHPRHSNISCTKCHGAETSSDASDVLMPDIAVCRECHVGQESSSGLRSGCISCHSYHQYSHPVVDEATP